MCKELHVSLQKQRMLNMLPISDDRALAASSHLLAGLYHTHSTARLIESWYSRVGKGSLSSSSSHPQPHSQSRGAKQNYGSKTRPSSTECCAYHTEAAPAAPSAAPATRKRPRPNGIQVGRPPVFPDSETACHTKAAPALAGASDASLAKMRLINGTCFHRKQQKWLQYYNRRI